MINIKNKSNLIHFGYNFYKIFKIYFMYLDSIYIFKATFNLMFQIKSLKHLKFIIYYTYKTNDLVSFITLS